MKEQSEFLKEEPQLPKEKQMASVDARPQAPEDLKALVEKNIKWSQVVYEQNRKILRRMTLMTIANYLRLALIVIPLIFALIYLPAFIDQYLGLYQEMLGGKNGGGTANIQDIVSQFSGQDIEALLKQYQR